MKSFSAVKLGRCPLQYRGRARTYPQHLAFATAQTDLDIWHTSLKYASPQRHLLLPPGHPDGSKECEVLALLGDSLLKTTLLTELLLEKKNSISSSVPGEITLRTSQILSNQVLSSLAESILVTPGTALHLSDIELLPVHGRATCVEAAVALVYQVNENGAGIDSISALVRYLLSSPSASPAILNPIGLLLEFGGKVKSRPGLLGGFIATAWLGSGISETGIEGGEWPSRTAAEAAACEAALTDGGLASDEARMAAKRSAGAAALQLASEQAGAQVQALWLLKEPLQFQPMTVTAASLTGASLEDGPDWIIRGLIKKGNAFQRLLGAPLALPSHILSSCLESFCWIFHQLIVR
jgi:hypothetical protein